MTKRTVLFSMLWLVLAAVISYSTMMLVLYFNLFSWHVSFDTATYIIIFMIAVSMVCCFILAKHTIGKIEIWFSLFLSIGLAVFGISILFAFYSETITTGIFSRTVLSPHWFRLTISTIYFISIIFWFAYPYKYLKKLKR